MRQLYTKRPVYQLIIASLLSSLAFFGCQKDYVDAGIHFRPDLSLSIPLLNKEIYLDQFGLDTIAYGTIQAISIPLSPSSGFNVPLNMFNRLMPSKFKISNETLSSVLGSIHKKSVFTSDSLANCIQNNSLALAFSQAVTYGSVPPIISQNILKAGQITHGNDGEYYESDFPLDVRIELHNTQNAILQCQLKLKTGTDSSITPPITIQPNGIHSTIVSLPQVGEFPINLSLVSFVYTAQGILNPGIPLFDVNLDFRQHFKKFDALLDTAIWKSSPLLMFYTDSLSSMAPRSQITLRPNTNFFFNVSSNLGKPMRRKIQNNGQQIADVNAVPGLQSQYSMGNKTIFGHRDTFEYQSIYYSVNSTIPSALTSRQITTTDVHTFLLSPKSSSVEFNLNIPLRSKGNSLSSLAIPYVDSAQFFDPIVNVTVESNSPYELGLQFEGENFPSGAFGSDSLVQKLAPFGGKYRSVFTFDSSNSFLDALTTIPLDSLVLKPKAKLLKNGNFHVISDSSRLNIRPELILPVQGRIRGFTYSDTLNLSIDSTLIHYTMLDTLILDFASSNPATLGFRLRILLLDSSGKELDDQSIILAEPSPYSIPVANGLTYSVAKSKFYILKDIMKKSKKLVYTIEIGGDELGRVRLPQQGSIRLEANLVIP